MTEPTTDTVVVALPGYAVTDVPASHAHYLITVTGPAAALSQTAKILGTCLTQLAEAGQILPGFHSIPGSDQIEVQVSTTTDPAAAEMLFDTAKSLTGGQVTVTVTHTSWGLNDTSRIVDELLATAQANARERAEAHAAGVHARDIREVGDPAQRIAEQRVEVDGTQFQAALVRVRVSTLVRFQLTPALDSEH